MILRYPQIVSLFYLYIDQLNELDNLDPVILTYTVNVDNGNPNLKPSEPGFFGVKKQRKQVADKIRNAFKDANDDKYCSESGQFKAEELKKLNPKKRKFL